MDPWSWLSTSIPAGAAVSAVGVGAFVAAILSGRLMTLGQHLRRVGDLTAHHERELAEKDARIAETKESRDGWKAVALAERTRANEATDIGEDVGVALEKVEHVLASLTAALPEPPKGKGNVRAR